MYAGLVDVGIAYATLVEVGRISASSVTGGIFVALLDVVELISWIASQLLLHGYIHET